MTTVLVPIVENGLDYVPRPIVSLQQLAQIRQERLTFVQSQLKKDVDYYKIDGSEKEGLAKAGAENLCDIFGFACGAVTILDKVEDWDRPFFRYLIQIEIINKRTGKIEGVGIGECNSHESKYRWRWVPETDVPILLPKEGLLRRDAKLVEFTFAVDKAETGGKYGKPTAYWKQFKDAIAAGTAKKIKKAAKGGKEYDAWEIGGTLYRVPNEDAASLVNTIVKMSKKRSFVDGVLTATHMSDRFTQYDEDEDVGGGMVIEGTVTSATTVVEGETQDHGVMATSGAEHQAEPRQSDQNAMALDTWILSLSEASSIEELDKLWKEAVPFLNKASGDDRTKLRTARDKRKTELSDLKPKKADQRWPV